MTTTSTSKKDDDLKKEKERKQAEDSPEDLAKKLSDIANGHGASSGGEGGGGEKSKKKKEIYLPMYYSEDVGLLEAFLLAGKPYFLWSAKDGKVFASAKAEQVPLPDERIVKPLEKSEYLTRPYDFSSEEELEQYVEQARKLTLDDIFDKVSAITKKYIVAYDKFHLDLLCADICYSYFQDKPLLTHYLYFVGDNDSGKSTNLRLIQVLGYRNLMEVATSSANIYRVLGSECEGAGTICEDEADNIEDNNEKMRIYKNGYTGGFPVTRSDVSNVSGVRKTIKFYTYGFKAFAAERLPDVVKAKGFNERCIVIKCIRGEPDYDLSEVISPSGVEEYEALVKELRDARNLLWAYRLLHRHDTLPKVDLNIKARERQLFSPLIRLFLGTKALQDNILPAISNYVSERRKSKVDSLHAFLYAHITKLIQKKSTNEINSTDVWQSIKNELPGQEINGKPLSYESSEFGTLSQKAIIQKLKEIFGAIEPSHHGSAKARRFNLDALDKAGKAYSLDVDVKVSLEYNSSKEEEQSLKTSVGLDKYATEESTKQSTRQFGMDGIDCGNKQGIDGVKPNVETANNQQEIQEKSQEITNHTGKSTSDDESKEPSVSHTSIPSIPNQAEQNSVNKYPEEEIELEPEPKNMQFFEQTLQDLQKTNPTIDYDKLKTQLITSGKFTAGEAHHIIEYAVAAKLLEKLDWHEYKIIDDLATELFTGEGPE